MASDLGGPGKTNDLDWLVGQLASWLAGWLAITGEARIRPWRSFWCIYKGIVLMESDLGSPGKTRKLMIWSSWLCLRVLQS